MAVAHAQISEVLGVIQQYVGPDALGPLLHQLQQVAAYRANASYRVTVDRLLAAHQAAAPPRS